MCYYYYLISKNKIFFQQGPPPHFLPLQIFNKGPHISFYFKFSARAPTFSSEFPVGTTPSLIYLFQTPVRSEKPVPMEMLPINNGGGQGYGFIVYRKIVGGGQTLRIKGRIRDKAWVRYQIDLKVV